MKSPDQIVDFILQRIGHIYFRPLMYGGTPDGVDLILHYYHEIWAEICERQEEYRLVIESAHQAEECGSKGFAHRFRETAAQPTEEDISAYVVNQWRKISRNSGLRIPYQEIRALFRDHEKLSNLPDDE